jgi:hypothetical protein
MCRAADCDPKWIVVFDPSRTRSPAHGTCVHCGALWSVDWPKDRVSARWHQRVGFTPKPVEERFWAYVDKNGTISDYRPDLGPCWQWTGFLYRGYGHIRLGGLGSPVTGAHRYSYEIAKGSIPDGLQVDHLCRNKACVNPDHLEPVTAHENFHRNPNNPAILGRSKTHCPRGHAYDEENTRYYNGGRFCHRCHIEGQRTRRAERRAAKAVA